MAKTTNFSCEIRQKGSVCVLDVSGRLTSFEIAVFRETIEQLLRDGRKQILLNLRELQYLDSSGIGELAKSYVSTVKRGGEMRVVGLSRRAEEVLRITQLYQVFRDFRSEEEAIRDFSG